MYARRQYLKKLIAKRNNGRVKIITGMRRSGKSVLLFQLYRDYLLSEGVKEKNIIMLELDTLEFAKYRNPLELDKYVRKKFQIVSQDWSLGSLKKHIFLENILYNDLIRRGLNVDVGVVEYNTKDSSGKKIRKQLEVDFVVNNGNKRYYIQSALSIADSEKKEQEIASLERIPDSFSKIVVVKDYLKPWQDDKGIMYIGIEQFLLDEDILR